MYGTSKRPRSDYTLGGRTSGGLVSTGQAQTTTNDTVYYNSSLTVNVNNDGGIVPNVGEHGRFAQFRDTRVTPLLPNTSKYQVGVTRAEVTTNNIPMFCPSPSTLVTEIETGRKYWEVSAQPGLSMTWTGPCYETNALDGCIDPTAELTTISYPFAGIIPVYVFETTTVAIGNGITYVKLYGATAPHSPCATVIITDALTRLNAELAPFGITVSVVGIGTLACTQTLTFTNSSATNTVVFDFTSTALDARGTRVPSFYPKGNILQACKLLGFAPNEVFTIGPSATVAAPRCYQLGFRSTFTLSAYKPVQWVPQDQSEAAYFPTPSDVIAGTTDAYFDCYSYDHFLNQCVNPALQRCIFDNFDYRINDSLVSDISGVVVNSGGFTLFTVASNGLFPVGSLVTITGLSAVDTGINNTTQNLDGTYTVTGIFGTLQVEVARASLVSFSVQGLTGEARNTSVALSGIPQSNLDSRGLSSQLLIACSALISATVITTPITQFTIGQSVNLNGRTYMWTNGTSSSNGVLPGDSAASSGFWQDLGPSFTSSWVPGRYRLGDVVTYLAPVIPSTVLFFKATAVTTLVPLLNGVVQTGWQDVTSAFKGARVPPITRPNRPAIGTIAPRVSFSPSTQLFSLNLDSYGFGGTQATNLDDGYGTVALNEPRGASSVLPDPFLVTSENGQFNDQARDSWGLTGCGRGTVQPYTTARKPFEIYDECFHLEADDYFHQLFGNWPCIRLNYTDRARNNLTTSYVRYVPEAADAGLTVPTPLPLFVPSQPPAAPSSVYLPYFRVGGNQPYIYTFPQNYRSVGNMWNPVDTLVLLTSEIPVSNCQVSRPVVLTDSPNATVEPSGNVESILCEFSIWPTDNLGQQLRSQILYAPTGDAIDYVEMQSSTLFNNVDWTLCMRMKATQTLRPLSISDSGAVNIRLKFIRKD